MQKMTKIVAVVAVLSIAMLFIGAVSAAAGVATSPGPAPNSGDCIPDGSGF